MTLIGELSLWVALLMAAWSTTVSYAGGALRRDDLTDSGVRGLYATAAMVALAAIGLWTALLSRDFSLEYVAGHISQNMPNVYVFAAFWSGQAGSMLFWALILSVCGAIAVATSRRRNAEQIPWTTGTLAAILLFFIATTCVSANPYARLDFTPLDGRGMNPQLHNPGMALNPPAVYLGAVATSIPFAFAIAALFTSRLGADWLGVVRRWTLLSWFFLTIGIFLGMWWAYGERGWGVCRAWDPVANSALLPWLVDTALLHSIAVQEKRGTLRKWNVVFAIMGFLLSIFGAFIMPSDVIESVHSFVQPPVEPWLTAFFFLAAGIAVYLVGTRLRDLGTSAKLDGQSPAFVQSVSRNRRRYGGHIAHAGIVMVLVAFAGLKLKREFDTTLKTGEAFQATDPYGHVWRFVSQGVSQFDRPDHLVVALALDAYRDGKRMGLITSEQRTYRDAQGNPLFEASTEAGIRSTSTLDAYVALASVRRENGIDVAQLRIAFNPLVVWVWAGGLTMVIGGLIVMWPE